MIIEEAGLLGATMLASIIFLIAKLPQKIRRWIISHQLVTDALMTCLSVIIALTLAGGQALVLFGLAFFNVFASVLLLVLNKYPAFSEFVSGAPAYKVTY